MATVMRAEPRTDNPYRRRWSYSGSPVMVCQGNDPSYHTIAFEYMTDLDPVMAPLQSAALQVLADVAASRILMQYPLCSVPQPGIRLVWYIACLPSDVEKLMSLMLGVEVLRWDWVADFVSEPIMPRLWPVLQAADRAPEARKVLWQAKDDNRAAWLLWVEDRYKDAGMECEPV